MEWVIFLKGSTFIIESYRRYLYIKISKLYNNKSAIINYAMQMKRNQTWEDNNFARNDFDSSLNNFNSYNKSRFIYLFIFSQNENTRLSIQKWSFPALVRGLNDKSIRRIHVMQCEFLMAAVDCPRRHHINEPVFLGSGYRLIEREKASKGPPRNEKDNGESGA